MGVPPGCDRSRPTARAGEEAVAASRPSAGRATPRRQARVSHFAASLAALSSLARAKGYRLVAVEPTGVNAYFLRSDLSPEIPELDPRVAFHGRVKVRPRTKTGKNRPVTDFREELWRYIEEDGLPLVDLDQHAARAPEAPDPAA